MPGLGNAWHIPSSTEVDGEPGMRAPLDEIVAGSAVTVFNGNQFQGRGQVGNQLQAGSNVFFRKAGDPTWEAAPLLFRREEGNNKYFAASLPDDRYAAGDIVQYYFKIEYSDRDTTFLRAKGIGSAAVAKEADAQSVPFSFEVRQPLEATGPFLKVSRGPVEARIYQDTGHVEVAGPNLAGAAHSTVVMFGPPLARLGGSSRSLGRVRSSTPGPDRLDLEQDFADRRVKTRLSFETDGVVRFEVTDWNGSKPEATGLAAPSTGAERFYGFGEKFNAVDQSGKIIRMETFDQPGNKGDRSYKVVPWFVSTRGYGLHFDTTAESTFDMRADQRGRYLITNPSGDLAFRVVYGPRLTEVLSRFTGLVGVGRPPLPPPFAFGTWISSDIWRSGGEIRYAVTKWRKQGIPASVFVFDSPWEKGYNDFEFNMTQFKAKGTFEKEEYNGFSTLTDMMAFLQKNGLKVICWMTPFVNTESVANEVPGQDDGKLKRTSILDDGLARGVFVKDKPGPGGKPIEIGWWKGKGHHVDFTDLAAKTWLQDKLRALVEKSKVETRAGGREPAIGGFKTDDGEALGNPRTETNGLAPAGGVYIRRNAHFADGRTGAEMRNGYCVEYHRAVWEVLGHDGLIFARSGFTGTQAFPGCWSGDNEGNFGDANGLPSVIIAGLSAAMSGYSIWSHDIGGYLKGGVSETPIDLFRRWTQFGCFTPIMQIHRQVEDLKEDGTGNLRQYPWGYPGPGETKDDNHALDHFRSYAQLHTALFPYIYTYAQRASDTGIPILRPLVLMHQEDPVTHLIKHTYFFGEELLVAPVIKGNATGRNVYLPAGEWVDFWTDEIHHGRQNLKWTSEDRTRFPVLVRRGAIIPMLLEDADTLCDANYVDNSQIRSPGPGLKFLIYPSGNSRFEVHDGTTISCDSAGGGTTINLNSPPRPMLLRVLGARPSAVHRDGVAVPGLSSRSTFDAADAGWRSEASGSVLMIKFNHAGGTSRVTF